MLNIHEIAPHVNIDKKCFEKKQFLLVDIRFYTAIFDAVQNLHGRPVLHRRAVFVFISSWISNVRFRKPDIGQSNSSIPQDLSYRLFCVFWSHLRACLILNCNINICSLNAFSFSLFLCIFPCIISALFYGIRQIISTWKSYWRISW